MKRNISSLIILFFCGVNLFAQDIIPLNEIAQNEYLPTSATYPFSFVVLADTRDNSSPSEDIDEDDIDAEFDQLMIQIALLDPPPEFVIDIGDVVNGGSLKQYQTYYDYISPWMAANSIAFFTVPGNNEFKEGGSIEHYEQYIGEQDFSFDLENVRIIAINNAQHYVTTLNSAYEITETSLDFVDTKLNELNAPPLKFGFTHVPLLDGSLYRPGYNAYYNLLKNHYPKTNFCGHVHTYHLLDDGCDFFDIITGGGGSDTSGDVSPTQHDAHHFLLVTVSEDNSVVVESHFIDNYPGTAVEQDYDIQLLSNGLTATVVLNNNTDCFGGNNGSATASGIGGTPPYNYSWDDGETTATAIALNAGEHVCTITDDVGCEVSVSVNTTLTGTIVLNNNIECFGNNNGSATASGIGGTSPYNYNWDNGENIATINNLNAGEYTCTITDDAGCEVIITVNITEPDELVISATSTTTCPQGYFGSITIEQNGGTAPYTYDWNASFSPFGVPVGTENYMDGLGVGDYTITVTDANNCTASTTVSILEELEGLELPTYEYSSDALLSNATYDVFEDIIVQSGATLTISNSTLYFDSEAGIIVEPGGINLTVI